MEECLKSMTISLVLEMFKVRWLSLHQREKSSTSDCNCCTELDTGGIHDDCVVRVFNIHHFRILTSAVIGVEGELDWGDHRALRTSCGDGSY